LARTNTFEQIRDETTLGKKTRLPLLSKLKETLGRRVVSLFSSAHPMGMILDDDADMITELLSVESEPKGISLIISSPGGLAIGAERIVHACREASNGDFEAIVPGQAKSAATIVCLGASKIHMTATAELGPIDPQINIGRGKEDGGSWVPAHVVIKSYTELMHAAETSQGRIEPFMLQLERYDAREIADIKREIELSKKIAQGLLSTGMMKGKSDN